MTQTRAVGHRVDQTAVLDAAVVGRGRRCRMQPSNPTGTRQKQVHCQQP